MKRCKECAAWLLLTLLFAPAAFAQYSIEVQKVETGAFPDVTANVVVRQNGVIVRSTDSSNFSLREDGFPQAPLHLTHPIPTQSYSLTILIGVGSTMSAGDVAFARGLATNLVNRMNGLTDETAIFTYDGTLVERQAMTNIQPQLIQAINNIQPSGGSNFVWDGLFNAFKYALGNSTHPSRTLVLISNGKADGGSMDAQTTANVARSAGVPIFCFGVNAVNSDSEMRQICRETGGMYYTNQDLLVQEMIDFLNGTPPASQLSYRSDNVCRDGNDRVLDVQVKMAADSVAVKDTIALSANSSGNVTIIVKTDTATVVSTSSKDVALLFTPVVANQHLYGGTINLTFDTSMLKLTGASTTGYLADGMDAVVAMTESGAKVTITGVAQLNGSGPLMMLTFKGGMVDANTDVQVRVASVALSRGCIITQPGTSRITVRPQTSSMSTKALPVVFTWNPASRAYNPDPAAVTVEVTNNGNLPLTDIEGTFDLSDDVRVAYGASRLVALTPSTLLPGEKGTATWYVQALPQPTEKTAQVNANFTSAEGAIAQHRLFLNIKAASSAVAMRCDADVITIQGGVHTPDPAEVRAVVSSAGTADSPAGDVTIVLPQDVTLNGGSDMQSFATMASGNSSTLTWELRYPQPTVKTDYPIMFVRTISGYPNDTCRVMLTVPALTSAQLDVTCDISPAEVDSTVTEVTYSVTVRNTGNADAANVSAALIVPVSFKLGTGEAATKAVGDPLTPNNSGTVTWKLVPVENRPCEDTPVNISTLVQYSGGAGAQCTASVLVKAGSNLLPQILSVSPVSLDTLATAKDVTFDVEMYDQERATLTYEWFINGNSASNSTRDFTHAFAAEGDYLVRVDVYDPCSIGVGPAVSHTWQVYVYNVSGIENPAAAAQFAILGNYPNPFNPGTVIEYRLPEGRHALRLEVLDAAGRVVRTLIASEQTGGTHRIGFDAAGLPSGSYVARLSTDGVVRTHRMMLLK
ncbi:MAG: VWA domain-containing protein [Bacteroidetes bacterium]|nr:VWA domain-containing protein [Bacteroidota bacterium]